MHALGGAYGFFSYVNSVDIMKSYCKKGYKLFEVDVNLTSDGVLVLAHRFNKRDYELRFGISNYRPQDGQNNGKYIPSYDEFRKFLLYDRFITYTFDDLIEVMRCYKDIYVMLDIGKIDYETTKGLFKIIVNTANHDESILWRIIVGGRKKEQIDAEKEVFDFPLYNIYYDEENMIDGEGWDIDCFIQYCKEIGATSISTSKKYFTDDVGVLFKKSGLLSYVFIINDKIEADGIFERGADVVGTDFLSDPRYEKDCLNRFKSLINERIFAIGLGSINGIKKTNSIKAFRYSYLNGIRKVEIDVRLTSDGKAVCVDGWHRDTYSLLGIKETTEEIFQPSLSSEVFLSAKYKGQIPTISFNGFLQFLRSCEINNILCIMDIGRPRDTRFYFDVIKRIIDNYKSLNINYIYKIERWTDVNIIKEIDPNCELMYHFVYPPANNKECDLTESVTKTLSECRKNSISLISLSSKLYSKKGIPELINENDMKACPFPFSNLNHVLWAIEQGAWLVGVNNIF